ncbi:MULTISPECIES: DUF4870 family protein [Pseudomonas]|uniref:DUF4870 family protein n=1 Tax=Pseudomonas TaxID=286 RepID=UPI000F78A550|nr:MULTISPECIES: hypothetical protein [Pseudomonas]RRW41834.1 hypothetical protein EGJ52_17830 [Pseudomonas luteola]
MTDINQTVQPAPLQQPIVSNSNMAGIVYVLYIVGFFNGVTALIGLILAYVNRDTADPISRSHLDYQIRTFWWGLLWLVLGFASTLLIIGWFVLLGWAIWTIYRIVKGLTAINNRRGV